MKIRAYLVLMVAAVLVPVVVFSTIALNQLLTAERQAALNGASETARAALISVERELASSEIALRMLAGSYALDVGDFAAFHQQARMADRHGVSWTFLLDENGSTLLDTSQDYGGPLAPNDRFMVAKVLAAGVPHISSLIQDPVTRVWRVEVEVPAVTASGKRYVIVQAYRATYFNDMLSRTNAPGNWLASVFDGEGHIIARNQNPAAFIGQSAGPQMIEAMTKRHGSIMRSSDGQQLYSVLDRSTLSGWWVAVGVPQTEIEASARAATTTSLLGLVAAIFCAAGAAWLFVKRLSRSIGSAVLSAQALGRGEAPGPMQLSGVVEVDNLQAAVVDAAAVVCLEKQSRLAAETEREQLLASEHAARKTAEHENRAKDEFLAMLGHELRNPLSAIVNAINVIGYKGMPPETVDKARQIIYGQSRHLTRIVDDLLDVGRIQSGKILLAREVLALDQVVARHVATLRETGRAGRHRLTLNTVPALIHADPTRIQQIIANLLDNAFKYTPSGGTIVVAVQVEGDEVVLTVSDDGVGISPELLPRLFELFAQGARALDRAQGGLGVGLALVRRLAMLHGGRARAYSAGVDQGSRFEVRLPRRASAGAKVVPAPAAIPSNQSVLLIEDNEDAREMMGALLSSCDYEVAMAVDGFEGLRLAAQCAPDIALVDIGLPGIDGYEVARRLRANPETSKIRLIALTGYGLDIDRRRALDAGFNVHVAKPVDLDRLITLMETP